MARGADKADVRGNGPALYRAGLGARLPDTGFIALVPGADVPLLPVDLPPGLKGAARERVARRQISDILGTGSHQTEIRPAPLGKKALVWNAVLVIDSRQRQAWCDDIAPAGKRCIAVLPDYLALPTSNGCWTVDVGATDIRVRLGPNDGFTAEPALAETLLRAALETSAPRVVLWLGQENAALAALFEGRELPVKHAAAEIGAAGLADPPRALVHGEMALDLARDPGADIADMRKAVRPLLLPLVLGVLALALWSGSLIWETRQLHDEALAHRRNAERIVRDTIIPTGPILDIRAQVSQRVDKRSRSAQEEAKVERPLDVFRLAGRILTETDTRVTRVSYRPNSGLVIDLQVSDFAALDALVAGLRARGIDLIVAQSSTAEDAGVEATLALASRVAGN